MSTSAPPQLHPNNGNTCEATINMQISLEFYAATMYRSMAFFLEQDMGQKHLSQYFLKLSGEKKHHADRLVELQNMRGGRVRLPTIEEPVKDDWHSSLEAVECAVEVEKKVDRNLANLQHHAIEMNDFHLCEFLEHFYLHQKNKTMTELGNHLTNLRQAKALEDGLAESLFSKLTLGDGATGGN